MDPAGAWKTQFVFRLQNYLVANCGTAGERLAAARPFVEAPIYIAGAAAARANLNRALEELELAHHHLHLAAVNMLALECLGLGGGSDNPAAPLPTAQHLGPPNALMGIALAKLQVAYPYADAGCEYIDWCRGILTAIYYLLEHPGLPNVDGLIAVEHMYATAVLNLAAQMLQACTDEATSALQGLLGP